MSNAANHSAKPVGLIYTRKLVTAALFLAISVTLKMTLEIYLLESLRFNLCNVPLVLTGVFLGPVWGFATACLSDIVNFILKPTGAFNPYITLVTGLSGLVPGLVFMKRKKEKAASAMTSAKFALANVCVFALLLVSATTLLLATKVLSLTDGHITLNGKPITMLAGMATVVVMCAYVTLLVWFVKRHEATQMPGSFRGDQMLFAVALEEVLVTSVFMPVVLYFMFGVEFIATLPLRFFKCLFMIPVTTILCMTLGNVIRRFKLIK